MVKKGTQRKETYIDGRRVLRPLLRAAALLAAGALLLALPIDWSRTGTTAALLAAGLLQPENAAAVLAGRLADGVSPPDSALTPVTGSVSAEPAGADNDHTETGILAAATSSPPLSTVTNITPPGADGTGGKILTQQLGQGTSLQNGIATKNRSGKAVDIAAALQAPLPVKWEQTDAPQVLIVHTHTTEGYMLYDAGYYNAADRQRTRDESRNVCAVGEAVIEALAQAGIRAVHDTTVHDDPQYTGAYTRSAETVEKNLKQYPSIRLVLDIHRDAIMSGDTDVVKPTVMVEGRPAAQMMIIAGVVSTSGLPHPYWEQNLALATQWQKALATEYPGLMRPLSTVASRYNQHICPGYLLVEVGAEGNTLSEAVYSGQLLGKTIAKLLA